MIYHYVCIYFISFYRHETLLGGARNNVIEENRKDMSAITNVSPEELNELVEEARLRRENMKKAELDKQEYEKSQAQHRQDHKI